MIILAMIVASGIVGWFAQTQRHRPGALWAALVFVLGLPWMMLMGFGAVNPDVDQSGPGILDIAYSVLPPFAVCVALLLVMPKLKPAAE